jgi:hypothetical protein
MKRCDRCGASYDDGLNACPRCGELSTDVTEAFAAVRGAERELSGELGAAEGPLLVVRKGPDVGETFYLDRSSLTIGRDPESDIFLNDVTVSRHHAVLEVEGDAVTVKDAGSLNGTYVNDALVTEAELSSGDALQIGRFQMTFLAGGGR